MSCCSTDGGERRAVESTPCRLAPADLPGAYAAALVAAALALLVACWPGPALAAPPTVAGESTELVREVQGALSALGYRPGPADGVMGSKTRVAIRAYQHEQGLDVDGRATPGLLDTLRRSRSEADAVRVAAGGDPAVAVRDTELRSGPSQAAPRTGGVVAAGERVTVIARSGRWSRLRSATGAEGWVAAAALRIGAAGPEGGDLGGVANDWLRQITGLLAPRERAPAPSPGVTIGIRGLDRKDIATAEPDPRAVDAMDAYRSDAQAARSYARGQRLEARSIAHLPRAVAPVATDTSLPGGQLQ